MSCTDTGLVLGKNAILQVYKAGQYRDFAVATDVSIDFKTDTKSVKTIGDGVWKRSRAQAIGYTISLSGLIKVGEFDDPLAFDLLEYQKQFTDLQYRIIFQEGAALKVIEGKALVDSTQFSGPSDGFATSQFNMTGNGEPTISDSLIPCNVTVTDITFSQESFGTPVSIYMVTSGSGTVLKWEYTINGGSVMSAYTNPFSLTLSPGTKSFTVTPVCTNGFSGTGRTENYTVG